MGPYEDDDEEHDGILKMLGGEVDDYAGSQLEDPDKKSQGVTVEISIKPHGAPGEMPEKAGMPDEDKEDDEHDPIAHILGMCGGGCTK